MKKILAIMLIAVIAVAGAFATMTQSPADVILNYTVTDTFSSKVGFKVAINSDPATDYVSTTAVNAGTAVGSIAAGSVKLDIYDMSYCNSAEAKYSYVTITKPAAWFDKDSIATGATFSVDDDNPLIAIKTGDTVDGTTTVKPWTTDTIKVAYPQSKIVDRTGTAVQIGTVTYKWIEDTEVVTGTATATFTVVYTAP